MLQRLKVGFIILLMVKILEKLKHLFFPKVNADVQHDMDVESIRNIKHVSSVAAVFEIITLSLYIPTIKQFDHASFVNIFSVLYCIFVGTVGWLLSVIFLKKKSFNHILASVFLFLFFAGLASWAVWNGYREYNRGGQMITFFAVILILVCFVPLKPLSSIVMTAGIYYGLLTALKTIDGAAGIHKLNYAVLSLVSLLGMIVRYHSQIRASDRAVRLQKHNEELEYNNCHDALTGLRNRYALNDDVEKFAGQKLTAFMIDVNYFKEINDKYGHGVGDEVLKETARNIEKIFPGSLCYRYGGDEFLVLDVGCKNEKRGSYSFSTPIVQDGNVVFSIGYVEGSPNNSDELFVLFCEADVNLYEMKRFTHAPENGGHDRRKPMPVTPQ